MPRETSCPRCGEPVAVRRNPVPTVDILIHIPGRGVVLIAVGLKILFEHLA